MVDLIAQHPFSAALLALTCLGLAFGAVLGFASIKFRVEGNPIADQVNSLLPQTQCGQCGYPGCKPYSEAIANGEAINRCPPGGEATMLALADLLDVEPTPMDTDGASEEINRYAYIREDECIGCTKCIQACPMDAILGAAKQMHTVIRDECTGCDLCVEPCPVDCIEMRPYETNLQTWSWQLPMPSHQLIASDAMQRQTIDEPGLHDPVKRDSSEGGAA